ncbi:helix-turn-helix domain-containing protein [Bradyrhizobium sp. STM 3557]|uniref:AraC family transcriptional regulator n=1 Tax=Bradyrhizobium sp. STM 3557 TaxID=578920 RepID=UPI00388ECA91
MLTQSLPSQMPFPSIGFAAAPTTAAAKPGAGTICREQKWRQFDHAADVPLGDIATSRWTDLEATSRREEATAPEDRYVIAIALRTTRLSLARSGRPIFDGIMPAGTLHVTGPSRPLSAHFRAPYDFLHFHVAADYFRSHRASDQADVGVDGASDLILLRDSLAEQLAKALVGRGDEDHLFTLCVGQTLTAHITRRELSRSKVNALAKWRLRRVEDYVSANFHRSIGLSDLAKVAGLSRMHFAAQFRAATGYRPREYLLHHRVERAKSIMSRTDTPLAEVALTVGFSTQAHFSTVFKRMTDETPARWRSSRQG